VNWLGLDIGGAHLKLADGCGGAWVRSFPLWRQPEELADRLRDMTQAFADRGSLAVTMTGELADCFSTKADGVRQIVAAACRAAGRREVRVYLVDGRLVAPELAVARPSLAAASNWHALARFAARLGSGRRDLLIDVGSTTCDIVPLVNGQPAGQGRSDTERLICGELVYTGMERTPVCAVVATLPFGGQDCPVAGEWFATTRDAYLLLGAVSEDPTCRDTADGRPATRDAARGRLARMICADPADFSEADALAAAQAVADAQRDILVAALRRVLDRLRDPPECVILSGHGDFLARPALARLAVSSRIVSLAEQLGVAVARCAPAHAVAVLAHEAAPR